MPGEKTVRAYFCGALVLEPRETWSPRDALQASEHLQGQSKIKGSFSARKNVRASGMGNKQANGISTTNALLGGIVRAVCVHG